MSDRPAVPFEATDGRPPPDRPCFSGSAYRSPMLSAALYDAVLSLAERRALRSWRRELLADLDGDVLELGAGTGANLAFYGDRVRLLLVEPDPSMRRRLVARAPRTATVLAGSASLLPVADASFDAVVSTLVLCSVGRLDRALSEVRRVLRPDGRLLLIEHVAAGADTRVRTVQHLVSPLWSRVAGGCSLERQTRSALAAAGFDTAHLVDDVLPVPVPFVRPVLRGVAVVR